MHVDRDNNEDTADYYNGRIPENLRQLMRVGQSILDGIDGGTSMTYAQFLQLKRKFDYVRDAMHSRDKFGMHSRTGKDRFRHIAHPEQYPAPEEKKAELV